jgi:predicted TIM-barrel fold metal-dependent hydrolase
MWKALASHSVTTVSRYSVDNIMFEGDYPHSDSNFPASRNKLADVLREVPDDQARKIAEDNARRVINFPRHDAGASGRR